MAILSLKRWERVAYEVGPGLTIHMKIKRLKRHEAKPLARVLIAVFQEVEKARATELSTAQKAAIMAQAYELVPEEQLKAWFSSCVKDVEGFQIDDEPVTTGTALLEEADDSLLFWLLMRLHELSKLSPSEGKGSSSPSGALPPAAGTDGSSSPAQLTEREDGAGASAATALIPEIVEPSIAQ